MAKSKKTNKSKGSPVDEGGSVRSFPGPHGPMISKNPDLSHGYYSHPSGKPGGGKSVGEWRKKKDKKRKQKAKEYGKVVANLASLYIKFAQDVFFDRLKPDDKITVYHATPDMNMNMIQGVDATQEHHRHYGGPRHVGLFVSPDFESARRFAPRGIVIEFIAKASELYGTDFSGRTYKEQSDVGSNPNDVWRWKFPESFSPYMSATLTQKSEPQALFKGILKPSDITRIYYEDKWYTLDGFYQSDPEYAPPGEYKKKKLKRLSFDPTDGDISLDEMYDIIEREYNYSRDRVKNIFKIYAKKDPKRLVEVLEQFNWIPSASKSIALKFMEEEND